jgi:hypothetical protein
LRDEEEGGFDGGEDLLGEEEGIVGYGLKVHGEERPFDVVRFSEELQVSVISEEPDKLVFEMKHVDAPIVNALRRIMIAEVGDNRESLLDPDDGDPQGESDPEHLCDA